MSRLINPGTGDIVDRLTILSLKILHGGLAGKATDHFERERNALLPMLNGKNTTASWYEHALGLHAVNSALWQAEDEMRVFRKGDRPEANPDWTYRDVALCAFKIQDLNDRRAQLISIININAGDNAGQEKL